MSDRCWLALLDAPAEGAFAQAALHDADGRDAGWLAAWVRASKPVRSARRVDVRVIDPAGEEAWCSLVWPPLDAGFLLFDDGAVAQARRDVLAAPPADVVSTLLTDDSHFAGAVTVRRSPGASAMLRDDPFARVERARIVQVGPGLFGRAPAPTGPTIERHGSAQPWPWDRF